MEPELKQLLDGCDNEAEKKKIAAAYLRESKGADSTHDKILLRRKRQQTGAKKPDRRPPPPPRTPTAERLRRLEPPPKPPKPPTPTPEPPREPTPPLREPTPSPPPAPKKKKNKKPASPPPSPVERKLITPNPNARVKSNRRFSDFDNYESSDEESNKPHKEKGGYQYKMMVYDEEPIPTSKSQSAPKTDSATKTKKQIDEKMSKKQESGTETQHNGSSTELKAKGKPSAKKEPAKKVQKPQSKPKRAAPKKVLKAQGNFEKYDSDDETMRSESTDEEDSSEDDSDSSEDDSDDSMESKEENTATNQKKSENALKQKTSITVKTPKAHEKYDKYSSDNEVSTKEKPAILGETNDSDSDDSDATTTMAPIPQTSKRKHKREVESDSKSQTSTAIQKFTRTEPPASVTTKESDTKDSEGDDSDGSDSTTQTKKIAKRISKIAEPAPKNIATSVNDKTNERTPEPSQTDRTAAATIAAVQNAKSIDSPSRAKKSSKKADEKANGPKESALKVSEETTRKQSAATAKMVRWKSTVASPTPTIRKKKKRNKSGKPRRPIPTIDDDPVSETAEKVGLDKSEKQMVNTPADPSNKKTAPELSKKQMSLSAHSPPHAKPIETAEKPVESVLSKSDKELKGKTSTKKEEPDENLQSPTPSADSDNESSFARPLHPATLSAESRRSLRKMEKNAAPSNDRQKEELESQLDIVEQIDAIRDAIPTPEQGNGEPENSNSLPPTPTPVKKRAESPTPTDNLNSVETPTSCLPPPTPMLVREITAPLFTSSMDNSEIEQIPVTEGQADDPVIAGAGPLAGPSVATVAPRRGTNSQPAKAHPTPGNKKPAVKSRSMSPFKVLPNIATTDLASKVEPQPEKDPEGNQDPEAEKGNRPESNASLHVYAKPQQKPPRVKRDLRPYLDTLDKLTDTNLQYMIAKHGLQLGLEQPISVAKARQSLLKQEKKVDSLNPKVVKRLQENGTYAKRVDEFLDGKK